MESGIPLEVIRGLLGIPIKSALGLDELPDGLFEETSSEKGILEERIIPPIAELVAGDDLDFKLEVDPEEGN